jgi:ribosomal protein S18 acetylase RimI-like enzyme
MRTTTSTGTVRRATDADVPALAAIIADAFFDDPTMLWIVPDPVRRGLVGPGLFRPFARGTQRIGGAWITDDRTGAALWIPPGHAVPAEDEAEAFGQQLAEVLDSPELERAGALAASFDEHLPEEPHAHLQLHGVRPTAQGRGLGSALLDAVLPGFDREGVAAYLEATNDGSRRLYERHGFVHLDDFAPDGGPTLRRMWREPRRAR